MPFKVIFLSSAEISIPLLEALHGHEDFELLALICQPDRAAGRKMQLKAPASKIVAERLRVPVFQPSNLNQDEDLRESLKAMSPDFLLTFAYGQILNEKWLSVAKFPALNVHTSLLPKYRGASPLQAALLNGDDETGISLMEMVKAMDEGPVYTQHIHEIVPHSTVGILHDELAELAAKKVPDDLKFIANNPDASESQSGDVSYCKKIIKKDAFVDFKGSAEKWMCAFRAYHPWPGLWTRYNGKILKLVDCELSTKDLKTGEVIFEDRAIYVGCDEGALKVNQLQLESKQCQHADSFVIGQPELCSSVLPS